MNAMAIDPSAYEVGDGEPPANVVPITSAPPAWKPVPEAPPDKHGEACDTAERVAKQMIAAMAEHGRAALHDMPPEWLPTRPLREIAAKVLVALDAGVSGWENILPHQFIAAPDHVRALFMDCVEGPYPPSVAACEPLAGVLRDFHVEAARRDIAGRISRAIESGEDVSTHLAALQSLMDTATARTGLLTRAYAIQYDPDAKPPADEVLMQIGQAPIAARGNLTVLQGKAKVGKSAVVASILGAAMRGRFAAKGDTLGIEWTAEKHTGAIVHFDTEQSPADWWALVTRAFIRSGNRQFLDRLVSIPLVQFARKERLAILEAVIRDQTTKRGTVDLVILDGVADLCMSPNDEEESLDLVARLMALCHKYNTTIICILHENPDSETGKTRGHLGSELNRKAFANLRIDKDKEGVSTLYGTDMRKRDIPASQGVCFAWNEEEKMHTVVGSAAEVIAERNNEASERRRERRAEEDRSGLEDVFGDSASLPYSDLWPAVMERFAVKERMAKTKISTWLRQGILAKNSADEYLLK